MRKRDLPATELLGRGELVDEVTANGEGEETVAVEVDADDEDAIIATPLLSPKKSGGEASFLM